MWHNRIKRLGRNRMRRFEQIKVKRYGPEHCVFKYEYGQAQLRKRKMSKHIRAQLNHVARSAQWFPTNLRVFMLLKYWFMLLIFIRSFINPPKGKKTLPKIIFKRFFSLWNTFFGGSSELFWLIFGELATLPSLSNEPVYNLCDGDAGIERLELRRKGSLA